LTLLELLKLGAKSFVHVGIKEKKLRDLLNICSFILEQRLPYTDFCPQHYFTTDACHFINRERKQAL
jgi:hypothetical protein